MAFTVKLFSLTFMAAVCFFLLAMESQSLDSKMEYVQQQKSMAGSEIIKSRKVQWVELSSAKEKDNGDGKKKEKMVELSSAKEKDNGDGKKKEKMVEWELREAPMGPDPLHHHGGSPITRTRKQP